MKCLHPSIYNFFKRSVRWLPFIAAFCIFAFTSSVQLYQPQFRSLERAQILLVLGPATSVALKILFIIDLMID